MLIGKDASYEYSGRRTPQQRSIGPRPVWLVRAPPPANGTTRIGTGEVHVAGAIRIGASLYQQAPYLYTTTVCRVDVFGSAYAGCADDVTCEICRAQLRHPLRARIEDTARRWWQQGRWIARRLADRILNPPTPEIPGSPGFTAYYAARQWSKRTPAGGGGPDLAAAVVKAEESLEESPWCPSCRSWMDGREYTVDMPCPCCNATLTTWDAAHDEHGDPLPAEDT